MLELAAIIILGIFAQWVSWRTKLPAILPLILIGLLVGPFSTFFTEDGCKWIQPMQSDSSNCNDFLFPGNLLFHFVSLAIGVILFEGGLTLKRKEIQNVGPAIVKLISLGSLITFIGAGVATHFILGLSWNISFLFAGLIIVTGPTVIAPILQNVPLTRNIATVLKWEGILIDPIGALTAVLVFEFILSGSGGQEFTIHALLQFIKIVITGFAIGAAAAYLLFQLIKKELVPHYLLNVFTLALVLAVFVASDLIAHESGLLSVVVMGMMLGNMNLPSIKDILYFKESLSVLLIAILFILLAANMTLEQLSILLDIKCIALFAVVVFVLRPLAVFSSTGNTCTFNEKLFISWVGPRGIVAAGIASLFGIKLTGQVEGAEYITPLVFMIVLGTVLLNATTARFVAKKLGVIKESADGILILGGNPVARFIAEYLKAQNKDVVIIDSNRQNIELAEKAGIKAFVTNVYTDELSDSFDFVDIGYLITMTGSKEVNEFAIKKYQSQVGEKGAYRLPIEKELSPNIDNKDLSLFPMKDDLLNLMNVERARREMNEIELESKEKFIEYLKIINSTSKSIPLFVIKNSNELLILSSNYNADNISQGDKLIYMGEPLN